MLIHNYKLWGYFHYFVEYIIKNTINCLLFFVGYKRSKNERPNTNTSLGKIEKLPTRLWNLQKGKYFYLLTTRAQILRFLVSYSCNYFYMWWWRLLFVTIATHAALCGRVCVEDSFSNLFPTHTKICISSSLPPSFWH